MWNKDNPLLNAPSSTLLVRSTNNHLPTSLTPPAPSKHRNPRTRRLLSSTSIPPSSHFLQAVPLNAQLRFAHARENALHSALQLRAHIASHQPDSQRGENLDMFGEFLVAERDVAFQHVDDDGPPGDHVALLGFLVEADVRGQDVLAQRDERRFGLGARRGAVFALVGVHAEQDEDVDACAAAFLLEQVGGLAHEAFSEQAGAELAVFVEALGEVVGFFEQGHEAEEEVGGDGGVDGVVVEELADGFDHEELQDAFCDDLVEVAAAGGGDYDGRLVGLGGRAGGEGFEVGVLLAGAFGWGGGFIMLGVGEGVGNLPLQGSAIFVAIRHGYI